MYLFVEEPKKSAATIDQEKKRANTLERVTLIAFLLTVSFSFYLVIQAKHPAWSAGGFLLSTIIAWYEVNLFVIARKRANKRVREGKANIKVVSESLRNSFTVEDVDTSDDDSVDRITKAMLFVAKQEKDAAKLQTTL